MSFRRNQVEDVVHALLGGPFIHARDRLGQPVPSVFKTRVKRLIEIDREWGRENRHRLKTHPMAFHDELPSGTGTDVPYSARNAFVLAIAVELTRFGFKQSEVVEAMGMLRSELTDEFSIATSRLETRGRWKERTKLGSAKKSTPDRDHAVFLALHEVEVSEQLSARTRGALRAGATFIDHAMCRGWDRLTAYLRQKLPNERPSIFMIELSELAARTVELLELAPRRTRGRQ